MKKYKNYLVLSLVIVLSILSIACESESSGDESGNNFTKLTFNEQKLLASDKDSNDYFGKSVAIDGDTMVVGVTGEDSDGKSDNGAVYVFTKSGNKWSQNQKLLASDKETSDHFGKSVAIDGTTVVVGADGESSDGKGRNGAVYIYQ